MLVKDECLTLNLENLNVEINLSIEINKNIIPSAKSKNIKIEDIFRVKDINFEVIYEKEIDKSASNNSQIEKNTPKGGIKDIIKENLKAQDKTGSVFLIFDR